MKIYNSSNTDLKLHQIGGKAYNLFRLKAMEFNVPDFMVIDQSVPDDLIPAQLKSEFNPIAIQKFLDDVEISSVLLDSVTKHFKGADQKLFAVRSSAIAEDGIKHSFAGQFETHLYVSHSDIPKFVKEIWKSNFSERILSYLRINKLELKFGIGVVIQEMIDPRVSGVAFGINPSTGAAKSKVICSVYGVGEGLVSGALNSDTYELAGNEITEKLIEKTQAARKLKSGEIVLENIPFEEQKKSSLNHNEILKLKSILDSLETKLGHPQDIEFAIKDDIIYLLQTRPITAIMQQDKKKNRIIWDNSNIIESYPGVTTPLTFSYILTAYKNVYQQLAEIMGANPKDIGANDETFANMLGLINGRVYYNLLSWYKVLALFPGYRLNARFMENMMGVKERFELPEQKKSPYITAWSRTVLMIFRIIAARLTIKKTTRVFMHDVNRELDQVKKLDLAQLSAYELKELWIALDKNLTGKWKAPLINDSFAMIYFGRLQKLVDKYNFSENKNIQNDLLCGSKDIISVEPIHRSIELATDISQNRELKQLFIDLPEQEIWSKIQSPEHNDILTKIKSYIDKFGERCVGELKLETISYKQDPSLFIGTLKSFVIQNITKSSTASGVDLELRHKAEQEVNRGLKNKPYKKWKLKNAVKKARYFVSNRENLRYERTRVFGITREIFSHIGDSFFKEKLISQSRDIFYLTKEEIFAFIDGTSVTTDLKKLIEIRKIEYALYQDMDEPSERFTTFETVNSLNDFYDNTTQSASGNELSGLGCCPGIIKAKVRIVKNPKEISSLNGDILVTSSTDPGWVTLFPTASAIIVERGSLLSHSAIVSREMGIPCIVGVTGLLKTLKSGDLVEMNGSTGKIKILNHE